MGAARTDAVEVVPEDYSYVFNPYREPIARAKPGQRVKIHTEDAFESRIHTPDDLPGRALATAKFLSPRRARSSQRAPSRGTPWPSGWRASSRSGTSLYGCASRRFRRAGIRSTNPAKRSFSADRGATQRARPRLFRPSLEGEGQEMIGTVKLISVK